MSVAAMAIEVTLAKAVPTTVGSTPAFVANSNPLDTPPAPGALTNPQAPSGAVVTNTGRTQMAAQVFTGKLNPLVGWNGVRTPANTP